MDFKDPPWLRVARGYIGQHEIAGTKHNPAILRMWTRIRAPFTDDETPWCAAFVGSCLEETGIRSTRSAGALSYLQYGDRLEAPALGCIAVKQRYNAAGKLVGGHVTFVVGRDKSGNLWCLGGNQNDAVSISAYMPGVFRAFRWGMPVDQLKPQFILPVFIGAGDAAGRET